jgi:ABC-type transport system involved in multi-copper enzyme maturation permease subunit
MKIFKFEYQKLRGNKILFFTLIGSIIIIITILIMIFSFTSFSSPNQSITKEQVLSGYQVNLNRINEELEDEELSDYHKQNLRIEKNKLEFLLLTQTIENEYLDITDSGRKLNIHQGTSLMFYLFNSTYILILLFAVFISIYTFLFDIQSGTIKNILASEETRKNVFLGKFAFQMSAVYGVLFIALFIAIIFGLQSPQAEFLVSTNGDYYALNCLTSFLFQSIGLIILVLVVSLFTNLLILITGNLTYTISIIFWLILGLFLFYLFMEKSIEIGKLNNVVNPADYALFINIEYFYRYTQLRTFFWTLGYSIFAIIIYIIQKRKFQKIDF